MRKAITSSDPDIIASFPALRRAARAAHALAKRTGTPLYVLKNGRVVNINPVAGKKRRQSARTSSIT
jgi:hypothetical protein